MKYFLARGGCCARDVTEEVRAFREEQAARTDLDARLDRTIREAEDSADGAELLARLPGYAAGDTLISAPDEVFEGWGIGSDGSFLAPRPPSGWAYDGKTGTFCRIGDGTSDRADSSDKREKRNAQADNREERKEQKC